MQAISHSTVNVTVTHITQFERVNTHVQLQYPERFVAITLVGGDGQVYKVFTRKHSGFAESVVEGGQYTVSGRIKRTQQFVDDPSRPLLKRGEIVLTNCVIGPRLTVDSETKRINKTKARWAKLMGGSRYERFRVREYMGRKDNLPSWVGWSSHQGEG
jgi:hypothetical protein